MDAHKKKRHQKKGHQQCEAHAQHLTNSLTKQQKAASARPLLTMHPFFLDFLCLSVFLSVCPLVCLLNIPRTIHSLIHSLGRSSIPWCSSSPQPVLVLNPCSLSTLPTQFRWFLGFFLEFFCNQSTAVLPTNHPPSQQTNHTTDQPPTHLHNQPTIRPHSPCTTFDSHFS